jgi:putative alpha-1,2-mannosidase
MISTHLDNIIADAVVKGITDFDVATAYEAMLKDAEEVGDVAGLYGRKGILDYKKHGYVPTDRIAHAAARTQDFAFNDFACAQVAKFLGKEDDADKYFARALNYRHTFDESVGFMRGRNAGVCVRACLLVMCVCVCVCMSINNPHYASLTLIAWLVLRLVCDLYFFDRSADGSWEDSFDEFSWGGAYIEGSAWQCTWAVPHDAAGLIGLMGGEEKFEAKLDRMLSLPPTFKTGSYGYVIHEMAEMASTDLGQYAHSNQPVHHVLYLYSAANCLPKCQYWVRKVLREQYTAEVDGLPGDEDNGEMSAWYIFSALGFYPLCPSHPSYTLGSPLFTKATVALESGHVLTIDAPNNSAENVYSEGVRWNNNPLPQVFVDHSQLVGGGTLCFDMQSTPGPKCPVEGLPFSLSTTPRQ